MRTRSALRRTIAGTALAVMLCVGVATSLPPTAQATTIHITIGATAPSFVVVPGTQVYYTTNGGYRIYRYNDAYYIYRNGVWYMSPALERDFTPTRVVVVPNSVVRARAMHHRHHHVIVKHKVKVKSY